MTISSRAKALIEEFSTGGHARGAIKKRAKEIKTDHALALELWESGAFQPRMLAVLLMDRKQITGEMVEALAADLDAGPEKDATHISEWLLANQLMKSKPLSRQIETWADHELPVLRRLFWYHQARLRWTGQTPPGNSSELMSALETEFGSEEPIVQWTMNFCAAWMGVHEPEYRERCIALGKRLGLYKEEVAPKGCTPNYLPEFIRIETEKRAG